MCFYTTVGKVDFFSIKCRKILHQGVEKISTTYLVNHEGSVATTPTHAPGEYCMPEWEWLLHSRHPTDFPSNFCEGQLGYYKHLKWINFRLKPLPNMVESRKCKIYLKKEDTLMYYNIMFAPKNSTATIIAPFLSLDINIESC